MHLTAKDRLTFKMLMAPPVQLSWCKHQDQSPRTNWTWQRAPKSSDGHCDSESVGWLLHFVQQGRKVLILLKIQSFETILILSVRWFRWRLNHCIIHIALQPLCCRRPCDHKKDAQLHTHPVHPVVAGHQGLALICTSFGKLDLIQTWYFYK